MQWVLLSVFVTLLASPAATQPSPSVPFAEATNLVVPIGGGWMHSHHPRAEASIARPATKERGLEPVVALQARQDTTETAEMAETAEESSCPDNCSGHGKCDNGVCACAKGYTSFNCSVPDCSEVFHCFEPVQGLCISPNNCSCHDGWTGKFCQINLLLCEHNCSGHGHCLIDTGECYCDDGYNGDKCEHAIDGPISKNRVWKRLFPPVGGIVKPVKTQNDLEYLSVDDSMPSNVGAKPSARHGHVMSSLPPLASGIIPGFFLFGGRSGSSHFGDSWILLLEGSLGLPQWQRVAKFCVGPSPRSGHTLTAVGTELYMFGGFDGLAEPIAPLGDMWRYSMEDDEWLMLPSLLAIDLSNNGAQVAPPSPRAHHSATTVTLPANAPIRGSDGGVLASGDVMVLFGGVGGAKDGVDARVWVFAPMQMRWVCLGMAPFGGRIGHSTTASTDGLTVYLFGGVDAFGVHQGSLWSMSLLNREWISVSVVEGSTPIARAYHVAVNFDGGVVIFGGETANKNMDDIWKFDPNSRVWSKLGEDEFRPTSRSFAASAVVGANFLAVWGGLSSTSHNHIHELWVYDFGLRKWSRPITDGTTPSSRILQSAVMVGDFLTVFGGEDPVEPNKKLRDLWTYDLGHVKLDSPKTVMWNEVIPEWEFVGEDGNSSEVSNRLVSQHGCTCHPSSRNLETGFVHSGCAINGFDSRFAWCDTVEPCRFGHYWDYCETAPNSTSTIVANSISEDVVLDHLERRKFLELALWPSARAGHAVTTSYGKFLGFAAGFCGVSTRTPVMIIFGGETSEDIVGDSWVYCPTSRQWSPLDFTSLPPRRTHTAITTQDSHLYIFGGINSNHIRTSDLWRCEMVGSGITGKAGGCSEIATKGWTPHARRGMMFSLENVKTCQNDCGNRDPTQFLMFNGYYKPYDEMTGSVEGSKSNGSSPAPITTINRANATSPFPHRCLASRPPYTDMFCDRECALEPLGSRCSQLCRCKRDFAMDLWEIELGAWRWDTRHVNSGPTLRFNAQAVPFQDKFYMFGGFEDSSPPVEHSDLWYFDLVRNEWRYLEPEPNTMTPPGRHEASFTVTGINHERPLLVLYGGIGTQGALTDLWICDVGDVKEW